MLKYLIEFILFFSILFSLPSCERTAFSTDDHSLPIVTIKIDEDYLWSPDSGLYVIGESEAPGCHPLGNYNLRTEYPAKIKFKIDGETQFSDTVGLRIKGTCSRHNASKSFGIYWRQEYGTKDLDYPLFQSTPVNEFKRLIIRSATNNASHLCDEAITAIIDGKANLDYQAYRACVLYLNKEYWGLYYIREMLTPHYFEAHYGANKDSVDLLKPPEYNPTVDDGSNLAFINEVLSLAQTDSLNNDVYYDAIANLIEIESYIDYIIVNTYIAKYDWPDNNGKWWRDKSTPSLRKWRWVSYDADWAFDMDYLNEVSIGNLYGEPFGYSTEESFLLFNHLIKNQNFKNQFLNRYMYFINDVFAPERVESIIMALQDNISDEYERHQDRWSTLSPTAWDKSVKALVEFNEKRNVIMLDIIQTLQHEN